MMRGLYYLMGAIALSVFVLGVDFIYAGGQPDAVAVEEDVVAVPVPSQPAAPVTLEGQTPNSAPVVVEPVNDANTATDNNADIVVIEEEAEEVGD